ncbi:unnamed protein product [Effrenium voratum]|nr:unnamed protein product [Effrenium voratum]
MQPSLEWAKRRKKVHKFTPVPVLRPCVVPPDNLLEIDLFNGDANLTLALSNFLKAQPWSRPASAQPNRAPTPARAEEQFGKRAVKRGDGEMNLPQARYLHLLHSGIRNQALGEDRPRTAPAEERPGAAQRSRLRQSTEDAVTELQGTLLEGDEEEERRDAPALDEDAKHGAVLLAS